ncbi:concanavalin A-like lectin/glucanase domain-containing protein [Rhizoctonia solani]|nr:concanavalin A-like lectin/glucanase domain-containing protein [Rhizoctonia solani]
MGWQSCTKSDECQPQSQGRVVLDADWRWVHSASGFLDCFTGNSWVTSIFKLKNQEFAFEVDASNLSCGLDGGLYFTQMDADGDIDPNSGTGRYGSCCNAVDIWEANSYSKAYLANPCTVQGQTRCSDSECANYCDKDGCDFNPYRLGDRTYYSKGLIIDTTKKITVVTQFITSDNTTASALTEIRRLYIQNGNIIQNAKSSYPELAPYDSITEKFCSAQKTFFGDVNTFASRGGFEALGDALDSGLVLVGGNDATQTRWLDSNYPPDRPATDLGVARGICRDPSATLPVEPNPSASVTFSNLRFGDIR